MDDGRRITRRAGLSRTEGVKPLLNIIHGEPRNQKKPEPEAKKEELQDDDDVTRLPDSSSSDSSEDDVISLDSDSDCGRSSRADIKPTAFKKLTGGWRDTAAKGKGGGKSSGTKRSSSIRDEDPIEDDDSGEGRARKRTQRAEGANARGGSQSSTQATAPAFVHRQMGFTKPRSPLRFKYGRNSAAPTKDKPVIRPPKKTKQDPAPKNKRAPKTDAPSPSPARPQFSIPAMAFDESPRAPRTEFLDPGSRFGTHLNDSPPRVKAKFLVVSVPNDSPQKVAKFDMAGKGLLSPSRESEGPPPSDLSSPLSDLESDDPDLDDEDLPFRSCLSCGGPVDVDFRKSFSSAPRLKFRELQYFCRLHKIRDGQAEWARKGYPEIVWDCLEARFKHHHDHLARVLNAKAASEFRDHLSDQVLSGKGRTLLKSDDSITPGYYGPRGMRLMSEHLIGHFAPLLRKRAVQDRVIAARGPTAFVQSVLVPELAVQLIIEDLGVSEESAKAVLDDSAKLGELLNEEIADVIPDNDSDSDGSGNADSDDDFA